MVTQRLRKKHSQELGILTRSGQYIPAAVMNLIMSHLAIPVNQARLAIAVGNKARLDALRRNNPSLKHRDFVQQLLKAKHFVETLPVIPGPERPRLPDRLPEGWRWVRGDTRRVDAFKILMPYGIRMVVSSERYYARGHAGTITLYFPHTYGKPPPMVLRDFDNVLNKYTSCLFAYYPATAHHAGLWGSQVRGGGSKGIRDQEELLGLAEDLFLKI
jgi:hypothetical protein